MIKVPPITTKERSLCSTKIIPNTHFPRITNKHPCPACGALTDRVHDYRMQTVKDVPFGRKTLLHLRKRRYRCMCGKRFLRKISFSQDTTESPADWSLRSSVRFMNWYPLQKLAHATTSLGRPQRDISNTSPLSRPNCRKSSPSTNSRATPGEKKYNSIIVDAEKHKVVDILPNRFENDLIKYFSQIPIQNRCKILCL
ncbi:MAG: transposase family protein [Lawsonibacter sp.]